MPLIKLRKKTMDNQLPNNLTPPPGGHVAPPNGVAASIGTKLNQPKPKKFEFSAKVIVTTYFILSVVLFVLTLGLVINQGQQRNEVLRGEIEALSSRISSINTELNEDTDTLLERTKITVTDNGTEREATIEEVLKIILGEVRAIRINN